MLVQSLALLATVSFSPCASGMLAAMSPCSAPPGTKITVKVRNPNRIYTALLFTPAGTDPNGRNERTIRATLAGKGSGFYSATLPSELCAPHNGGHLIYDVNLAGALGIRLDKLGQFDVICST